ncbi:hypothetical protein ACW6AV_003441 [Edwardsiella piscicida]|uniref:Conjugative transfer protein 345 n=1 Tax=Edwardsiella anguillarum ET080813 TaxID=667120 RepID=A0A076LZ90_9GAMM|nr:MULTISPECIES: hypothetical protein [Edwardsiella]EGA8339118.1 hypothetical protein [Salmonella enterica subsp. enterica serovar Saintpaul]EKG9744431.1 hypothetical protein [Salmonella enterica]NJS89708.1 hypothetical protein [Escherichia coli]AIJ10674.1 Conjugative transfer protein 345 [Edwardsiella anguillarum ET080813]EKS7763331.1 hypothetical protein [Edwardsiella ictaluri]
MDIKTILIASVLGSAGGLLGSNYIMDKQITAINDRLNQSPPIVIVDFAKLASSYPAGASQEEVEQLMVKTNNAIVKLKDAGYLVLDSSSVVGAPRDVYLPDEALK